MLITRCIPISPIEQRAVMSDFPKPNSKIARKYVSFSDRRIKTPNVWLECKRKDDAIGSLWRVYDDLYDLRDFVEKHPGGSSWLTMTQGTDITEAFETHHLNTDKVLHVLHKYRVAAADEPRNILLTFRDDGFYRSLKRRVVKRLDECRSKSRTWISNLILDALLAATLLTAIVSTYQPLAILPAGLLMMLLIVGGHNYLHQRDNFRMFYFNIGFFSFREWRVSHALSHHLFPNTRVDMEMSFFEPLLNWWPHADGKNVWNRYVSWTYGWMCLYPLMFVRDFCFRLVFRCVLGEKLLDLPELVPFGVPLLMFCLGSSTLGIAGVLRSWLLIVCCASFLFSLTALNAGHHHPEVFHDGDTLREDTDWGLFQLDTMIERSDLKNTNRFVILTQFGEHILHHLFPTVDHGDLKWLHAPLAETLAEFGTESRTAVWPLLIAGQHLQLARVQTSDRLAEKL